MKNKKGISKRENPRNPNPHRFEPRSHQNLDETYDDDDENPMNLSDTFDQEDPEERGIYSSDEEDRYLSHEDQSQSRLPTQENRYNATERKRVPSILKKKSRRKKTTRKKASKKKTTQRAQSRKVKKTRVKRKVVRKKSKKRKSRA